MLRRWAAEPVLNRDAVIHCDSPDRPWSEETTRTWRRKLNEERLRSRPHRGAFTVGELRSVIMSWLERYPAKPPVMTGGSHLSHAKARAVAVKSQA